MISDPVRASSFLRHSPATPTCDALALREGESLGEGGSFACRAEALAKAGASSFSLIAVLGPLLATPQS